MLEKRKYIRKNIILKTKNENHVNCGSKINNITLIL